MIETVAIEHYRGIERLSVGGLGRVNIVTGRNDCGKTSFLEAVISVRTGTLGERTQFDRGVAAPVTSFDAFWRPFFFAGDAHRGLSVRAANATKAWKMSARREAAGAEILQASPDATAGPWSIIVDGDRSSEEASHRVVCDGKVVTREPAPRNVGDEVLWCPSVSNRVSEYDLRSLSMLKSTGEDGQVVEMMRLIDDDVTAVDILAPTGSQAAVYVRTRRSKQMLPISSLGEGTRRCFDLALPLLRGAQLLGMDEIDNGLHHSALEAVWSWIASATRDRGAQLFATAHSEECIQAAARAFRSAGDDGLRVVRLDRREHETTAAIYDADLVLSAKASDVEIRG